MQHTPPVLRCMKTSASWAKSRKRSDRLKSLNFMKCDMSWHVYAWQFFQKFYELQYKTFKWGKKRDFYEFGINPQGGSRRIKAVLLISKLWIHHFVAESLWRNLPGITPSFGVKTEVKPGEFMAKWLMVLFFPEIIKVEITHVFFLIVIWQHDMLHAPECNVGTSTDVLRIESYSFRRIEMWWLITTSSYIHT